MSTEGTYILMSIIKSSVLKSNIDLTCHASLDIYVVFSTCLFKDTVTRVVQDVDSWNEFNGLMVYGV